MPIPSSYSLLQDRYEVRQTQAGDLFAGLFDGHGGWQAASYISMYMSNILENELTNHRTDTPEEVRMAGLACPVIAESISIDLYPLSAPSSPFCIIPR